MATTVIVIAFVAWRLWVSHMNLKAHRQAAETVRRALEKSHRLQREYFEETCLRTPVDAQVVLFPRRP